MTSLLAGCNVKDWFSQQGNITIQIDPMGAANTTLTDFRKLTVAVYGVTIKQYLMLDSKQFSYGDQPKLFDFVEKGMKGEPIPVMTDKINIRAVESVTLHLDVFEAIDAQGKNVPVCREGEPVASFPCFFMPLNGAYRHQDKQFSTVRGGSVTFNYPLGVRSVTENGQTEYFIFEDVTLATVETSR